ncbi:hypothetical protein PC117_g15920 [Phytophthora cactorum]|uniref:Uncharacterized protein n=1 Tax=Phytophthora cactorum TaxID=29920 RepID=A0A8T1CJI1_9STRA|nr:hypothetical protein PC117_g15920 [Phytophthora cactorum]
MILNRSVVVWNQEWMSLHYPGAPLNTDLQLSVAEEPKPKKPTTNKKPRKVTEKSKKTQERTVKAQRKKYTETLFEREFSKGKVSRSVVCRLQTICPDQRLVEEIKQTARAMKQIQLETWHLVNLPTLRCLENDLPLPDYGKTFFDHCCAGVASTSQSYAIATKNPSLWDSIQINRAGRTRAGLEEVASMTGYSELKQAMREQLVVNAGVMIREHFRKRLRAYVLIKFGKTGDDLTSVEAKASKKLVGQIMYACYNVEETDMLEALQMRDVLTPDGEEWSEKWNPWPDNIKKNGMEFYIRLIWEFQSVVEDRMEAVPNEKGVRVFSLFPVSTSFTNHHIVINGTTFAGFVSRIRDRGQGNLMEDWNMPQVKIFTASFKVMRWTVMRRAFAIDRFETRKEECPLSKMEFLHLPAEEKYEHASHLFANEIKTDGYSASALYYRPKHEELGGEDDSLVPEGYSPDVVIGLDPGMRPVCTAAREYLRLQAPRRRSRRNVRRPRRKNRKKGRSKRKLRRKRNISKWIRRAKRERHRNNRDIVSVTTREYRYLAGFNRFRAWNESQKRKFPDYKSVIEGMPSFKTSSYEKYLKRLDYFWQHAAFLLRFCLERPYLKWRFFQKRMARVAVDEIARRIVPTVSSLTCVAYGDWSQRDGIKGHAPSPVKGLKEALRKRAMVVSMDEFRTSKLCSQCHQSLSSVQYPTPVFPKGVQKPKRRKMKGKVLPRDWSRAEIKSKHCHVVLRCENEDCEARYWDRDVNAAINLLELLKSEVQGGEDAWSRSGERRHTHTHTHTHTKKSWRRENLHPKRIGYC